MFKSQEPDSKIQQSWLINILLKLDIYFLVLQLHLSYIFKFSSSKYFLISSMPHLPCLGFTCWDHVSAPQQCDPAQGTVGPGWDTLYHCKIIITAVKGSCTSVSADLASEFFSEGHFPVITSPEHFTQDCLLLHKAWQEMFQVLPDGHCFRTGNT